MIYFQSGKKWCMLVFKKTEKEIRSKEQHKCVWLILFFFFLLEVNILSDWSDLYLYQCLVILHYDIPCSFFFFLMTLQIYKRWRWYQNFVVSSDVVWSLSFMCCCIRKSDFLQGLYLTKRLVSVDTELFLHHITYVD